MLYYICPYGMYDKINVNCKQILIFNKEFNKLSESGLSEFSEKGEEIYNSQICQQLQVEDLKGKIIAIM